MNIEKGPTSRKEREKWGTLVFLFWALGIFVGSTREMWATRQAAKKWVGLGSRAIRSGRGSGDVIGEISADGTKVARFTSINKPGPYINLENKLTGGNLHVSW